MAVHGGRYASGLAFRQAFPAESWSRSCRNMAPDRPDAGEFQPG
jgi:hypothetical protein